ncbi:ATP-binding protein [Micromonospora maritima]|uniref:ATP-binding protein n=1 Tax=Micromonospora maritima TaxID=986711 RepID=A0ABW7ZJW2_9ACTN
MLLVVAFTSEWVPEVRHTLTAAVARAGLTGDEGEGFVLAVHELVTNAVRHGGGTGELRLHRQPGRLSRQVSDHGDSFVAGCDVVAGAGHKHGRRCHGRRGEAVHRVVRASSRGCMAVRGSADRRVGRR